VGSFARRLRCRVVDRRPVFVLLALLIAAGVAACSSGGPKSNGIANLASAQIVTTVDRAMDAQSSVHIAGNVASAGQSITLDVSDGRTAGGGQITLNGAELDVVLNGSTIYLRGTAASWTKLTGSASTGSLLGGKWLKADATNSNFSSLAEFLTVPGLVKQLSSGPAPTKGPLTTVAGLPVLTLTTANGTSFVRTTGQPLVVEARGNGANGGSTGTVTFSQYGTAAIPSAPSGAVDISSLG
jgi:hypothetical protein